MPAPIRVELAPHSSEWEKLASAEGDRLRQELDGNVIVVHHIGSTSISGICAKPIIDLMPVVHSVGRLDRQKPALERLGYECWGEYGIPGRRYFTLDDALSGRRRFQVHCFEPGCEDIGRHLAFRDYLRSNRAKALEYQAEKRRCRALHPDDSHAYTRAKADWIAAHLPAALDRLARQAASGDDSDRE